MMGKVLEISQKVVTRVVGEEDKQEYLEGYGMRNNWILCVHQEDEVNGRGDLEKWGAG